MLVGDLEDRNAALARDVEGLKVRPAGLDAVVVGVWRRVGAGCGWCLAPVQRTPLAPGRIWWLPTRGRSRTCRVVPRRTRAVLPPPLQRDSVPAETGVTTIDFSFVVGVVADVVLVWNPLWSL